MFIDTFNKYEWAQRGYEKYVSTLPEDVRRHMLQPKDRHSAFVIVYGPSQVGKTTLILKMMGLSSEGMKVVSRVLRGKQSFGESSTAVATMYRRSRDNQWGLEWKNKHVFSSDSDMEQAVCDLRKRMENGGISASSEICVVSIPKKYFEDSYDNSASAQLEVNDSSQKEIEIRILDLPGVEAAKLREREYAKEVAQKFVAFATLILLVSKVDRLGVFFKDLEELPTIKNWMHTPGRFRIITTYSFTSESTKESIKGYGDKLSLYKKHLINQMETFQTLPNKAKVEEMYYFLEFGASWETSSLKHKYIFLDGMMTTQFDQLLEDVAQANSPLAYLSGVLESKGYAHRLNKEKLDLVDREKRALKKKIESENTYLDNFRINFENVKNDLDELSEYFLDMEDTKKEIIPIFFNSLKDILHEDVDLFVELLERKKFNVSDLREIIYDRTLSSKETSLKNIIFFTYNSILKEAITGCKCEDFFISCSSAESLRIDVIDLQMKNFKDVFSKLDSYFLDWYWSDDSYNEDKKLILYSYRNFGLSLVNEIMKYMYKEYYSFEKRKIKKKSDKERELYVFEKNIDEKERELYRLKNNLGKIIAKEKAIKKDYERTCLIIENMKDFFINEYLAELDNGFKNVLTAEGAGSSFFALCHAKEVMETRSGVFDKLSS